MPVPIGSPPRQANLSFHFHRDFDFSTDRERIGPPHIQNPSVFTVLRCCYEAAFSICSSDSHHSLDSLLFHVSLRAELGSTQSIQVRFVHRRVTGSTDRTIPALLNASPTVPAHALASQFFGSGLFLICVHSCTFLAWMPQYSLPGPALGLRLHCVE